jgi:RND family efflux transporter MFP subunit
MTTAIPHNEPLPPGVEKKGLGRLGIGCILLAGLLLAAGLVAAGIFPRLRSEKHREEATTVFADSEPSVVTFVPKLAKSQHLLTLPGSLEPFQEITVNARADGFVRKWFVDIGDHVKTGQLLATLEAPELQQQRSEAEADVAQARAQVFQAEADVRQAQSEKARLHADEEKARAEVMQQNAEIQIAKSDENFARVTNDRWQKLVAQQAISLEDADKRASAYTASRANVEAAKERETAAVGEVKAAQARQVALMALIQSKRAAVLSARSMVAAKQAAVSRIEARISFLEVRAPFSGVITARPVDVGSLVSAGGGQTELFKLARSNRLRLFVDVPEDDVPSIQVGMKAGLHIREYPNRAYTGVITRTAGSLDTTTRTLKTQIELNNPGELDPGMHAEVSLDVRRNERVYLVPSTAIVIHTAGPKLVTLDSQNRVHFTDVKEGLDYGREIEIVRGLDPGERVVNFPSDSLVEGTLVKPTPVSEEGTKKQ